MEHFTSLNCNLMQRDICRFDKIGIAVRAKSIVWEMLRLFSKRTHYINWGILLSLFRKIPKIPKTTPVDGFQHVRGQCGVVFHALSNGEVNVQIS